MKSRHLIQSSWPSSVKAFENFTEVGVDDDADTLVGLIPGEVYRWIFFSVRAMANTKSMLPNGFL